MSNEETRKILDLLAQGKISVEEAEQLMSALGDAKPGPEPAAEQPRPEPRFLRITVTEAPNDWRPKGKTVNIRVPMSVVRGGIKLGAFVPGLAERWHARMHPGGPHLDFSKLTPEELERVLQDLGEVTIDEDNGRKQVRIHCE